jgi:ParB-like chromosome segregation protein Spo0J
MVRPILNDPEGYTYQMIAGSLRLRSVLKLIDDNVTCYNSETAEWLPATVVYKTLKCQVRECDEETAIRISVAENLEHTQVPELDLMEYCQELTELRDAKGELKSKIIVEVNAASKTAIEALKVTGSEVKIV